MKKSPRENLEAKFKIYAEDWLEAELKIEGLELNGEEVPEEVYETRWVMWENVNFILDQTIKLGLMDERDS
jgi:hypothetical protein